MTAIYKYKLDIIENQLIKLPKGYDILTAQAQDSDIMVWAVVDPDEEIKVDVRFVILGTGNKYDKDSIQMKYVRYLSTVQLNGMVWHIGWDLRGEK